MKRKGRKRIVARLRKHPDPILSEICSNVEDGDDFQSIMRDMRYIILNNHAAVGLAAPQVGHAKRIIATRIRPDGINFYINPVIINRSEEMTDWTEYCLSYPGKRVMTNRHESIEIMFDLEQGGSETMWFDMFAAIVIQHELDHLDGKCIMRG